jgi:lactam utilization protein B
LSTLNGKSIQLQCETICIHSDTPNAIEFAKAIYQIVNF